MFIARVVAVALVFVISVAFQTAPPRAQAPRDRLVVLISLDGFPGWALQDPRLPVPTLRRMAREGAVAAGMRVVNPAVTWPNHTTLVSGVHPRRHGVLFNGLLMRQGHDKPPRVFPWRDKSELVRVPTVYDLAYRAGMTTAQVDWVAVQNAGTLNWEFAERPNPTGALPQEMVSAGLIAQEEVENFNDANRSNAAWRDLMWTRAAVHIIERHRPNLLLFHLLQIDGIHHRYSARTPAGYAALAYADTCVERVLRAIETAGLAQRATVFVVSDHGFKSARRSIRPNALLREKGWLRVADQAVSGDAYIISEGGTAFAYVLDPAKRATLVPKLRELLAAMEGIARIVEPADYAQLGLPQPEVNDQVGDLLLVAKDGYNFSATHEGAPVVDVGGGGVFPGHHGSLSTDPDMNALFIAWGYGIRPGVSLDLVSNLDVAPTIARLLGLKMENIEGKEISEILENAKLP